MTIDLRIYLMQMAKKIPIAILLAHFPPMPDSCSERMKITNFKCLRAQLGLDKEQLVKIKTDQELIGILRHEHAQCRQGGL